MPEIRVKLPTELYRTLVMHASDIGISENQYAMLLLLGVAADESYEKLLRSRGMQERIEAAQRRAEGINKRLGTGRKGLFS